MHLNMAEHKKFFGNRWRALSYSYNLSFNNSLIYNEKTRR